jgi:hypothetical protein
LSLDASPGLGWAVAVGLGAGVLSLDASLGLGRVALGESVWTGRLCAGRTVRAGRLCSGKSVRAVSIELLVNSGQCALTSIELSATRSARISRSGSI